MPLFLFDIDLTLLDAVGAGRSAMTSAFRELHGVDHAFDGVQFQGRTDTDILCDALARHGIPYGDLDGVRQAFQERYVPELERALNLREGRLLPGVRALLGALATTPEVEIGVATGNFRRGALVKLSHFGLLDVLHEGGFGDLHADRADVIAAAAAQFGRTPAAGSGDRIDVAVLGDTSMDIAGALANGFAAVGVATGFDSPEDLRAAGATLVLGDLADTASSYAALMGLFGADGRRPAASGWIVHMRGAAGAHTQAPGAAMGDDAAAEPGGEAMGEGEGGAAMGDDVAVATGGEAMGEGEVGPSVMEDAAAEPGGEAMGEIEGGAFVVDDMAPGAPNREVEAKFALADAATADRFLTVDTLTDGGRPLGPVRTAYLTDTYLDTPDRALLRRGLSLRTRDDGPRTEVTVKALARIGAGAVHDRFEAECVFGPEIVAAEFDLLDPNLWPDAMRSPVLAATGPEPEFVPLCRVDHVRHHRDVFLNPGDDVEARFAELVVETVAVFDVPSSGAKATPAHQVGAFHELELELAAVGGAADLEALAAPLADMPGLVPLATSKFERALRLAAEHPTGYAADIAGVQPDMPMHEAGRLIWRRELVEILLNEAGARLGADIEFVHDMRVATRRARASGALFAAWFEPKAIARFQRALRKTGRRLGAVRDLDVAIYKLKRHGVDLPKPDRVLLKPLVEHWRHERRLAYVELFDWLDSAAYRRFVADFAVFCATPGAGAVSSKGTTAVPTQVRHVMPMAIFDRYAAVRAYEAVLEDGGEASVPVTTLHALRISCKYLRYALEMVRHLLGPEGEATIRALKHLQDHLGDLNDAVVARDTLRQIRRGGLDGGILDSYIAVQEDTVQRLRETFPEAWHAFVAPENRAVLLQALARL